MKNFSILILLAFSLTACRSDKSIYKVKKKRKGKCDCPHMSNLKIENSRTELASITISKQ